MMATNASTRTNDVETASVLFGGQYVVSIDSDTRIARGSFGVVDLGLYRRQSGGLQLVALKTISQAFKDSSRNKLTKDVAQEVKALQKLDGHKNIVSLRAILDRNVPPALVLVMEYCPVDLQTSMEWRRRSCRSLLSVDVVKMIAHEMTLGLAHCHQNGIVHRDIRPANLLVSSNGHIKLCDFGLALPLGDSLARPLGVGLCALQYRSPELLLGGAGDHPPSDVFAAGLVVAELLSGKIMFAGRNVIDQLQRIFLHLGSPQQNSTWFDKLPDFHTFRFEENHPKPIESFLPRVLESPHLGDFLQSCFCIEPVRRPATGVDLLHHVWWKGCTKEYWRIVEETVPHEMDELFMGSLNVQSATAVARRQARLKQQLVQSLVKWN